MTIIGNFHGLEERVSFVSSTIKIGDIVCDQRYTNLRSVSKEFKDKIALPLLVKMQEHHGLVPFNILQFPVEILVQIAEKLSDKVILTDDNVRSENPQNIIHDILIHLSI